MINQQRKGRNSFFSSSVICNNEEWCELFRNKIVSLKLTLSQESRPKSKKTHHSMCSIRTKQDKPQEGQLNKQKQLFMNLNLPSIGFTHRLGRVADITESSQSSFGNFSYSQREHKESSSKSHLMKIRLRKKHTIINENAQKRLNCSNKANVNSIQFHSNLLSKTLNKEKEKEKSKIIKRVKVIHTRKKDEEIEPGVIININPILTKVIRKIKLKENKLGFEK